jgi:hypothetical protein
MANKYLLAIYPNLQAAERTVNQLLSAGYTTDQVGVASSAIYGETAQKAISEVTNLEINIFAGILRQLLGHWGQPKSVHVAGIGNLLVMGVFNHSTTKLEFFEASLGAIGVPPHRVELILESLRQGDALVCVCHSQGDPDSASSILCQYKPVDIEARVRQWRLRGWQGFDAMSDPYSVEEIIRKKRQYTPPRTDDVEDCVNRVLQFYHTTPAQDT